VKPKSNSDPDDDEQSSFLNLMHVELWIDHRAVGLVIRSVLFCFVLVSGGIDFEGVRATGCRGTPAMRSDATCFPLIDITRLNI
jgi:hypothetical protein